MKRQNFFTIFFAGIFAIASLSAEQKSNAYSGTQTHAQRAQEAARACLLVQASMEHQQLIAQLSEKGIIFQPSFEPAVVLTVTKKVYEQPLTAFFEEMTNEKLTAYHLMLTCRHATKK